MDIAIDRSASPEVDLREIVLIDEKSGASWYPFIKTVVDILAAAALLVITAPVILAAMLLVKLTSRGPALYTQTRVGRGGRSFTLYKIRSMTHDCERHT